MASHPLPLPPVQMSPAGDEVWTWADRLSAITQRNDEIRRLQVQVGKRSCGDCTAWITRSCPREKSGGMTGRSTGPSADAHPCAAYTEKPHSATLRVKRQTRLDELRSIAG